jgi:hypothetical protein
MHSKKERAGILKKRVVHPFALQGLPSHIFIEFANKILAGEYGLISFRGHRS